MKHIVACLLLIITQICTLQVSFCMPKDKKNVTYKVSQKQTKLLEQCIHTYAEYILSLELTLDSFEELRDILQQLKLRKEKESLSTVKAALEKLLSTQKKVSTLFNIGIKEEVFRHKLIDGKPCVMEIPGILQYVNIEVLRGMIECITQDSSERNKKEKTAILLELIKHIELLLKASESFVASISLQTASQIHNHLGDTVEKNNDDHEYKDEQHAKYDDDIEFPEDTDEYDDDDYESEEKNSKTSSTLPQKDINFKKPIISAYGMHLDDFSAKKSTYLDFVTKFVKAIKDIQEKTKIRLDGDGKILHSIEEFFEKLPQSVLTKKSIAKATEQELIDSMILFDEIMKKIKEPIEEANKQIESLSMSPFNNEKTVGEIGLYHADMINIISKAAEEGTRGISVFIKKSDLEKISKNKTTQVNVKKRSTITKHTSTSRQRA